jgi:hypothetical protein
VGTYKGQVCTDIVVVAVDHHGVEIVHELFKRWPPCQARELRVALPTATMMSRICGIIIQMNTHDIRCVSRFFSVDHGHSAVFTVSAGRVGWRLVYVVKELLQRDEKSRW